MEKKYRVFGSFPTGLLLKAYAGELAAGGEDNKVEMADLAAELEARNVKVEGIKPQALTTAEFAAVCVEFETGFDLAAANMPTGALKYALGHVDASTYCTFVKAMNRELSRRMEIEKAVRQLSPTPYPCP